ncbi:MAG: hypothetical protein QNJ15_01370 [Erythrobacter sp.]|nr:hypothetical protein [Erythrobacter sp.]
MTSSGISHSDSETTFRENSSPFGLGVLSNWKLVREAREETSRRNRRLPVVENPTVYPSSIIAIEGMYFISFDNVARFEICFHEEVVTIFDVAPETTPEALTHLLYDHVAPRILAGIGQLVIHASAVEIGGRLALFLGETGAGKSTLAASLHKSGHRLMGDDASIVAPSTKGFVGQAVYPSLRLYQKSISAVLGANIPSAPMAHYSEKKRLNLPSLAETETEPVPLGAFFFLVDEASKGSVASHPLSPGLTCIGLIENSFALDPSDATSAANRMEQASAVARAVPGYELSYPWDFDLLPRVHEQVFSCMRAAAGLDADSPAGSSTL